MLLGKNKNNIKEPPYIFILFSFFLLDEKFDFWRAFVAKIGLLIIKLKNNQT
jgi:hypothetical protein